MDHLLAEGQLSRSSMSLDSKEAGVMNGCFPLCTGTQTLPPH